MLSWYAVHSKPRQEEQARQQLQRQGYATYLPRIRLRKRRRGKWAKVVEPLFPRYLFIQVDADEQSLAPVRSTLGVAGLVRFGHLLRPVPDQVIECIRQAEDPDTHQHHDDEWPHKPGDEVRILEGPCAGLNGIFQAQTGEERALLLIELLGRQTPLTVDLHHVGPNSFGHPRVTPTQKNWT